MDEQLLFLINRSWTHPVLDWFMALVTSWGIWMVPTISFGVLMMVMGGLRERAMLVCLGLVIGVGDGLVGAGLKNAVKRPRPYEVMAGVRMVNLQNVKPEILQVVMPPKVRFSRPGKSHGGRSFPSSHTLNNFAVATVLALFYRRGVWWFPMAGLIGWSRIYTGSHWPSDVLISTMLGCGLALILMALLDWLWRKFGATRWPALPSLIFFRTP